MQLRNKLFPYPIITENGDGYDGSYFNSKMEKYLEGYNLKLRITSELVDEKLNQYINDEKVVYAYHIECPQTCYRRVIKTKENETEVTIKDKDVNGTLQVCTFLVANDDLENYSNDSFSADYRGFKFNIDKGCIMAVGSQFDIKVDKIKDDFTNSSSIFSIVPDKNQSETNMRVDLNQQKIVVSLPEKIFRKYSGLKNVYTLQPIMHAAIIVPALLYTFSELIKDGDQLFLRESYRWFRNLKKACKKMGIAIDEESLKSINILEIVQKLLDGPICETIEFCSTGGEEYDN